MIGITGWESRTDVIRLLIGIVEPVPGMQDGTTLLRATRVAGRLEDIERTAGRASIVAATIAGARLITMTNGRERGTRIRIRPARLHHRALMNRVPAEADLRTSQLHEVRHHRGA